MSTKRDSHEPSNRPTFNPNPRHLGSSIKRPLRMPPGSILGKLHESRRVGAMSRKDIDLGKGTKAMKVENCHNRLVSRTADTAPSQAHQPSAAVFRRCRRRLVLIRWRDRSPFAIPICVPGKKLAIRRTGTIPCSVEPPDGLCRAWMNQSHAQHKQKNNRHFRGTARRKPFIVGE